MCCSTNTAQKVMTMVSFYTSAILAGLAVITGSLLLAQQAECTPMRRPTWFRREHFPLRHPPHHHLPNPGYPEAGRTTPVEVSARDVAAFNVSFTDRGKVLATFEEGDLHLTTGKSSSCARPDHLDYNFSLPDCGGCRGLRVRMDDKNATCSRSASISTGHLASNEYFSYGDFEINIRTAHSINGGHPPANAFTCFSGYTSHSVHNEIALCWPATDTGTVHFGYWNGKDGDHEHRTDIALGFNASAGFHRYKFAWRKDGIMFSVDGKVVHHATGDAIPTENLSMRIILRPNNVPSTYEGEALMTAQFASYTPAATEASGRDNEMVRHPKEAKHERHAEHL